MEMYGLLWGHFHGTEELQVFLITIFLDKADLIFKEILAIRKDIEK